MVQPGLEISNQAFEFVAFSLIALESENFSLQLWKYQFQYHYYFYYYYYYYYYGYYYILNAEKMPIIPASCSMLPQ